MKNPIKFSQKRHQIPKVSWSVPVLARLPPFLGDLLEGGPEAGVSHVLLAQEVVVDALLRVAHDQESAANVANFHRLNEVNN